MEDLKRNILPVQRFLARKALISDYFLGNRYILDDLSSASDTNLIA